MCCIWNGCGFSYFVRDVFSVSRDESDSELQVLGYGFKSANRTQHSTGIHNGLNETSPPSALSTRFVCVCVCVYCVHLSNIVAVAALYRLPSPKQCSTKSDCNIYIQLQSTNYHSLLFYKVLNEALTSCCFNTVSWICFSLTYSQLFALFSHFLSLAVESWIAFLETLLIII